MSFIQCAFIRKNTPKLRKQLNDLGYRVCPCCDYSSNSWLFTMPCADVHVVSDEEREVFLDECGGYYIDCAENEKLFLALAALRDDCDLGQYFKVLDTRTSETFIGKSRARSVSQEREECEDGKYFVARKMTVKELIEHFKNGVN